MTLEDDRSALRNHWDEFQKRAAYAYTVLSPDGEACLGCVYIDPVNSNNSALDFTLRVTADQLTAGLD